MPALRVLLSGQPALVLAAVTAEGGPAATVYASHDAATGAYSAPLSLPATLTADTTLYVATHGSYALTVTTPGGTLLPTRPVMCAPRLVESVAPRLSVDQAVTELSDGSDGGTP